MKKIIYILLITIIFANISSCLYTNEGFDSPREICEHSLILYIINANNPYSTPGIEHNKKLIPWLVYLDCFQEYNVITDRVKGSRHTEKDPWGLSFPAVK